MGGPVPLKDRIRVGAFGGVAFGLPTTLTRSGKRWHIGLGFGIADGLRVNEFKCKYTRGDNFGKRLPQASDPEGTAYHGLGWDIQCGLGSKKRSLPYFHDGRVAASFFSEAIPYIGGGRAEINESVRTLDGQDITLPGTSGNILAIGIQFLWGAEFSAFGRFPDIGVGLGIYNGVIYNGGDLDRLVLEVMLKANLGWGDNLPSVPEKDDWEFKPGALTWVQRVYSLGLRPVLRAILSNVISTHEDALAKYTGTPSDNRNPKSTYDVPFLSAVSVTAGATVSPLDIGLKAPHYGWFLGLAGLQVAGGLYSIIKGSSVERAGGIADLGDAATFTTGYLVAGIGTGGQRKSLLEREIVWRETLVRSASWILEGALGLIGAAAGSRPVAMGGIEAAMRVSASPANLRPPESVEVVYSPVTWRIAGEDDSGGRIDVIRTTSPFNSKSWNMFFGFGLSSPVLAAETITQRIQDKPLEKAGNFSSVHTSLGFGFGIKYFSARAGLDLALPYGTGEDPQAGIGILAAINGYLRQDANGSGFALGASLLCDKYIGGPGACTVGVHFGFIAGRQR